jgi:hypothetical protein
MKKLYFFAAFTFSFFISTSSLSAQNLDNPGDYISAVNNATSEMNKANMAYTSAFAHSGRARKIERLRQQTITSILNCKDKLIELPIYKGDNTLRKSMLDFTDLCYKIFNDDYGHIVNMEDIIEQSVDEMEVYLLLQEKTNEKLQNASAASDTAERVFAAKHNVNLVDEKSDLDEKIETSNNVTHYQNQVYILFFKCNWEDGQVVAAINAKNINKIEQTRNALISYANEGFAVLDTLKPYNGDHSLANACRQSLNLYKSIGENDVPKITDAILKQQNFDKIQNAYNANSDNKTKADVDAYNKAVNDVNASVANYNAANEKSSNSSKQAIQDWTDGEKSFLDVQIPYYKQ